MSRPRKSTATKPSRPNWERAAERAIGPQLGFAATTFAGFAAWAGAAATLPPDLTMPLVATLFLTCAAVFAVIAWRNRDIDPLQVTYTDVAGALTLIGLCAAATIDPEQMVRVVESSRTDN